MLSLLIIGGPKSISDGSQRFQFQRPKSPIHITAPKCRIENVVAMRLLSPKNLPTSTSNSESPVVLFSIVDCDTSSGVIIKYTFRGSVVAAKL